MKVVPIIFAGLSLTLILLVYLIIVKVPLTTITSSLNTLYDIINTNDTQIHNTTDCRTLSIGSFNIFEGGGFTGSSRSNRLRKIIIYLQKRSFDILALQELNNWSPRFLRRIATRWGHNYTAFLTTHTGYHLGLTSRIPFCDVEYRTEGFHHGMIHARFPPLAAIAGFPMDEIHAKIDIINDDTDDLNEISVYSRHIMLTITAEHIKI